MADALSMVTFINCWAAATARPGPGFLKTLSPRFDMASIFPPRPTFVYKAGNGGITKEKIAGKSFVFDNPAISALKAKYAAGLDGEKEVDNVFRPPSRLVALTTFIWGRLVAATRGEGNVVVQAVNLRARANPPLPESYFGNLSRFATVVPSTKSTLKAGFDFLIQMIKAGFDFLIQMREAIQKVDGDYVKKLQEGNVNPLSSVKEENIGKRKMKFFAFSSLIRFPVYEADFGWGKPVWVTFAPMPLKNLILFLPTRSGEGIEGVFLMTEEDMAKLEADKEFLSFVSPKLGAQVLLPSSL